MPYLPLGLSLMITVLAILPFHVFNLRIGWLLSVLVTEYGHWLAPVILILCVVSLRRRRSGRWAAPLFFPSFIVFCLPTVQLWTHAPTWRTQLENAFGPTESNGAVSFTRLFTRGAPTFTPDTVTYAPGLTFDHYSTSAPSPAPWVLVIHGGGWNSGDSSQMPELNAHLAARGYHVISMNYRLAPASPWPAARDDVRAAIAFVKAHAAQLKLDPKRYVILGRSAGGQLAQIIAYADHDPDLRGCISLYAPTDMVAGYEWGEEKDILGSRPLIRDYMGGPPDQLVESYREASPLHFVSAKSPPTLLLHGARDPLVWVKHSERLRERLNEFKVANALIEIPWGTHGFDYNIYGPGGQALTLAVNHFLERILPRSNQ